MNKMIDVVHDTIYQFFGESGGEEEPLTEKQMLLLNVNKAICENLRAIEICDDAISREKAMDIVSDYYNMRDITRHEEDILYEIMEKIENLPSVYPKQSVEVFDKIRDEIAEEICLTDNPYTKETKYTIEHSRLLEILDKTESEDKG